MKRYLIITLLALSACKGNSNSGNSNSGKLSASIVNNPHTAGGIDNIAAAEKPTLDFKDTLHDFGQIHEGEVVEYDFAFTNNGKTPLLITSASGSCGCTVPEYPENPIAPGQSGIMKVKFNSQGKNGPQQKSVTIHANTLRNIHMLYIKSEVLEKNNK